MNNCIYTDENGFLMENGIYYIFPNYVTTENSRFNYVLWFMLKNI